MKQTDEVQFSAPSKTWGVVMWIALAVVLVAFHQRALAFGAGVVGFGSLMLSLFRRRSPLISANAKGITVSGYLDGLQIAWNEFAEIKAVKTSQSGTVLLFVANDPQTLSYKLSPFSVRLMIVFEQQYGGHIALLPNQLGSKAELVAEELETLRKRYSK